MDRKCLSNLACLLAVTTLVCLGIQTCSAKLLCYEGTEGEKKGHAVGCSGDKPFCYSSGLEGGPVQERGCAIPVTGKTWDRKGGETCEWNGKEKVSECKCFEDYCNARETMSKEEEVM